MKNPHSLYVTLHEGIVTITSDPRGLSSDDISIWYSYTPVIEMTKEEQGRAVTFFNDELSLMLGRTDVNYNELGDAVDAAATQFVKMEDSRNES